MWFSNVPHPRLVEDKGGQNWIAIEGDKFIFPGGGTQFIHGANQYLDQIAEVDFFSIRNHSYVPPVLTMLITLVQSEFADDS